MLHDKRKELVTFLHNTDMSTPHDPSILREASVTIDGAPLSFAEVMTLRVALSSYLMMLKGGEVGSGPIVDGYIRHGTAVIRRLSYPSPTSANVHSIS